MRTSAIKEIILRLGQISFLAVFQSVWLFCTADLFFSSIFGSEIDARKIIPVYIAAVLINVIAISTLRLFLRRTIVNLLAVAFIFTVLPPFNLSIPLIISGKPLANNVPAIFLGLSIILTVAIYWFQGFRLAAAEMSFQHCLREFQFGIFILLLVFAAQAMSGSDRNYFVPMIICFVCGMIILFLSRRERPAAAAGFSIMINATAFVCIILTVICGLLLAVLFNPDLAEMLYKAGKSVLVFIGDLIKQIASFFKPDTSLIPMKKAVQKEIAPEALANSLRIPEVARNWIQISIAVIFSIMSLAALWSISLQIVESFRRRKNKIQADVQSFQMSYLKKILALIKNAIAALMKKLLWQYRRRGHSNDSLAMRFIYGQILSWAAMKGYPQKVSQTPYELFPQLTRWLPEAAAELNFITNQFVNVRYGEVKLNKDMLQQAWSSYNKIKQCKRRLFFQRRRK